MKTNATGRVYSPTVAKPVSKPSAGTVCQATVVVVPPGVCTDVFQETAVINTSQYATELYEKVCPSVMSISCVYHVYDVYRVYHVSLSVVAETTYY